MTRREEQSFVNLWLVIPWMHAQNYLISQVGVEIALGFEGKLYLPSNDSYSILASS
jgi:hypothetical protein